jgi:hypothetical protein
MTVTLNTSKDALQTEVINLRNQVQLLQEQLNWFKRQIFGKCSEKIVRNQGYQPLPTGKKYLDKERIVVRFSVNYDALI